MRDLETGDLDDEFATLFRTMPVAFAYAEMSAAFDRYAASEIDADNDDEEVADDVEAGERKFIALSDRLSDTGLNGDAIRAAAQATSHGVRRVYH
jgi:hypothetical protein